MQFRNKIHIKHKIPPSGNIEEINFKSRMFVIIVKNTGYLLVSENHNYIKFNIYQARKGFSKY